jgi:hypothetical protein
MDAQERKAYLEGYGAGAAVVQGHVELGMGGVGVELARTMALDLMVGGAGLAVAQGLADAALAGEGR